jgi:S-adenosylmethionine:tRNA ribosyltransferase-isomerase
MEQKEIRISEYNYELPNARIAKYPLAERDASKLLVWREGTIREDIYRNIHQYLTKGTLLIFNNTRVIPARLHLRKPEGGVVELFCLEPEGELSLAMTRTGNARWKCMVGGAKKWKDTSIHLTVGDIHLEAFKAPGTNLSQSERGTQWIDFQWEPAHLTFSDLVSALGSVPLPPYLQRPADEADRERYQTIYAREDGSVAAPTAGLHFTDRVFSALSAKNIRSGYVTLHVGAGTFRPVQTETLADHEMHAEYIDVSVELIQQLLEQGKNPVVAVGTTSLRTLESLFLMGSKLLQKPHLTLPEIEIQQWDAFAPEHNNKSRQEAYTALLQWLQNQHLDRIVVKTRLLIAPGYHVRTIDALVTNFHQPSSTLLLLVAAITGSHWRDIYAYALEHDFRFLSYGDGSLIFNPA